jgi:hypothetical protein
MCYRIALAAFVILSSTVSFAAGKPRVYITDSQSWSVEGNSGGSSSGFGGHVSGGARPQTAEIIKTFTEHCPDVVVNNIREKADYIAVLDHEGGKGWARKDNKFAVFKKDGDSIVSKSTRSLGNSVKDACEAIVADWNKTGETVNASQKESIDSAAIQSATTAPVNSANQVKTTVDVGVSGAEIEVDGAFIGTTPSTIDLSPGEHEIKISRAGYKTWQRKIKVTGGSINVSPTLEKE